MRQSEHTMEFRMLKDPVRLQKQDVRDANSTLLGNQQVTTSFFTHHGCSFFGVVNCPSSLHVCGIFSTAHLNTSSS